MDLMGHCEERSDEAISSLGGPHRDCFALLAMTTFIFKPTKY